MKARCARSHSKRGGRGSGGGWVRTGEASDEGKAHKGVAQPGGHWCKLFLVSKSACWGRSLI